MTSNEFVSRLRNLHLTDRASLYRAREDLVRREEETRKLRKGQAIGFLFVCILIVPIPVFLPLSILFFWLAKRCSDRINEIESAYQQLVTELPN
jgi:hypothetical protein